MIAALVFTFSSAMLAQFFFSYLRLLVVSSRAMALSRHVLEVAGVDGRAIPGDDFSHLMQLLELCPKPGNDSKSIRAVRMYFRTLNLIAPVVNFFGPRLASRLETERQHCSYFVALLLDHRLTFGREAMAQQALSSF